MTANRPELHVHVGVDGVLEELFEQLFKEQTLNDENTSAFYISAETYRDDLRNAVDGKAIPLLAFKEQAAGRNLFISRPRMIYPGAPLNCVGEGLQYTYKLRQLQQIFPDYKVCFHLFLTDHIAYLFRHENYVEGNYEVVHAATWKPLIDILMTSVFEENELLVWNAEEPEHFLPIFLQSILHVPEADCPRIVERALSLDTSRPSAEALEEFVTDFGLEQVFFDYLYEGELRALLEANETED
ncbi:hypothetical protein [Roseobacter sp. A03A-229]